MESQPRTRVLSKWKVARLSSHGEPIENVLSIQCLAFQFGESISKMLSIKTLIPHFKVMENLPSYVMLSKQALAKFSSQIEESIHDLLSTSAMAPHAHVNHKAYTLPVIYIHCGFPKPNPNLLSNFKMAWN